jgi:hypothetical protein
MNPSRVPSSASLCARVLAIGGLVAAAACGVTDLDAILLPSPTSGSGSVSSGSVAASPQDAGTDALDGTTVPPAVVPGKKGLAYGYNTVADLEALGTDSRGANGTGGIWWWLNWTAFPDTSLGANPAGTALGLGIEYVPMIFNPASITGMNAPATLRGQVPPGSKYVLTFNVANFTSPGFANVTPDQAAAAWPNIEAFANSYHPPLKIVSPTVDYCTTDCVPEYSNPFVWLDAFISECAGCRIDYIGVRTHTCDFMSLVSDLHTYESYGKPIWVTEIWCDPTTEDAGVSEEDYMELAIPDLDEDQNVFRYGWYTGRPHPASDGTVGSTPYDILSADAGQLTPLGACYLQGACSSVGSE